MRRLLIAIAIVALPAFAAAQTTTTSTSTVSNVTRHHPHVTPPNRPNHPNRPGNTNRHGYQLSPVIMMNGYAISATPAPRATHEPRVRQKDALQQDQFGSWSTSGR